MSKFIDNLALIIHRFCRFRLAGKDSLAMGTGPSQSAVSNLDLKPRTNRKSPNSSRGVMAKAITPPPLLAIFPHQPPAMLFIESNIKITFQRCKKGKTDNHKRLLVLPFLYSKLIIKTIISLIP